jgi:uncharacterized OB-fold protein
VTDISDKELLDAFPDVLIDHDNKEYYRGWLGRRLLIDRCGDCGYWIHPPRPMCPECWSRNVTASEVSGRGTLHLLVKLHQGPPAPNVDYATPHPVATIELSEQTGLRITSTVVGWPVDDLRIGMPVELTWIERWGAPYPVFEPARSEDER